MHWLRILPFVAGLVAALPEPRIDLNDCSSNPVVFLLNALHLTSFCSSYLHVQTQTIVPTVTSTVGTVVTTTSTSTVTEQQTSTTLVTLVVVQTSTSVVPGQTVSVTQTITSQTTFTQTSTISTTSTTTTVTTSYSHQGGIAKRDDAEGEAAERHIVIPSALRNYASSVVSTACSCIVTTPTVTVTTTATETSTSISTIAAVTTTSPVVATVTPTETTSTTTTALSTAQDTTFTQLTTIFNTISTTTTQTSTSVVTATSTVAGARLTLVASYSTHCIPYNYLNLFDGTPVTSYAQNFQYCADQCAKRACGQIWISDNVESQDGFWCLTGSSAPDTSNFDMTWTSSEIQCNYPPVGKNAEWYSFPT